MKGAKPSLDNVLPFKGDTKRPVPPAPDFMSDEGRRVWEELAPHLVQKDRLDPVYEINFASYCEAAADFIRLTGEIAAYGSWLRPRRALERRKSTVRPGSSVWILSPS